MVGLSCSSVALDSQCLAKGVTKRNLCRRGGAETREASLRDFGTGPWGALWERIRESAQTWGRQGLPQSRTKGTRRSHATLSDLSLHSQTAPTNTLLPQMKDRPSPSHVLIPEPRDGLSGTS